MCCPTATRIWSGRAWLDHHLVGKPTEHAYVIRPFLHWFLLRRAGAALVPAVLSLSGPRHQCPDSPQRRARRPRDRPACPPPSWTSPDGSVRLTVRSRGRDTRRMHQNLHPGLPAVITGPYGMFDHTVGGPRQIWIAGGIGVAPFLGWLTTERVTEPERIDLFYSTTTEADAVFLPDLTAATDRLPNLTLHPVFTRDHGRLTVDRISALAGTLDADTHVFLCGPAAMVDGLGRDLHRHGIPRDYIHTEHFAFR